MPLYEYACQKCGKHTERIEKYDGPPLKKCPHCGGKVERLLSAPAIQFKGSGWYVTDYAKKSTSPGSSGDSPSKDKKDDKAKSDGGSKESSSKESASKESSSKESSSKESSSKEGSSKESVSKESPRKGSGRHK